ncbi:MAG TPA: 4Fe-4S binding protein [Rhodocyclaceae bacterium]
MQRVIPIVPIATAAPTGGAARVGEFLRRRRAWVLGLQWLVVLAYALLVAVPAFLPLPAEDAHLWNNLTRAAQFAFWGLWWPGVMIVTVLFGRVWCGVFCPEGSLTEWASRRGLGRPVPRWMKWGGWPFVAFLGTTVYGQLVSVYEYPQPALLVLGGSTVAAVAIGFVYGKGHRVWCRHLCPANGVFGLLAKLAPLHYRVDRAHWDAQHTIASVDCAPLVDIRRMQSASDCHACGRCSSHRDSVWLALRRPWAEILDASIQPKTGEVLTLLFGLLGVATAAFQWSSSPYYVEWKLALAEWLVDHGHEFLLQDDAPWWLLTHVPAANDVFTWLDGVLILAYLLGGGAAIGAALSLCVALAAWVAGSMVRGGPGFHRLALALVPMGAASVVLGLSMLTLVHLKAEHIVIPWLDHLRIGLLALGATASLYLAWRLTAGRPLPRRLASLLAFAAAPGLMGVIWYQVLFVW